MNEDELSIALGLSREIIKEIREAYDENIHWFKEESKKSKELWNIKWTPEGISMLKTNLGLPDEPLVLPSNKTGKVVRKFTNPRIIGVILDEDPEKEHNVICRDSSKFKPDMPVEVRWDGARWCIVRHPRFAGKY